MTVIGLGGVLVLLLGMQSGIGGLLVVGVVFGLFALMSAGFGVN